MLHSRRITPGKNHEFSKAAVSNAVVNHRCTFTLSMTEQHVGKSHAAAIGDNLAPIRLIMR